MPVPVITAEAVEDAIVPVFAVPIQVDLLLQLPSCQALTVAAEELLGKMRSGNRANAVKPNRRRAWHALKLQGAQRSTREKSLKELRIYLPRALSCDAAVLHFFCGSFTSAGARVVPVVVELVFRAPKRLKRFDSFEEMVK